MSSTADPFGTAALRSAVLDAWRASPSRFREDANAEEELALGPYRNRLLIELAQKRGIEVQERTIWPEELESFESFFLTGSAAETAPLLAVLGTVAALFTSYWMMAATQMANLLGLTPLESAQRLGPVLAGELVKHMTSGWDIAFAALALVLAWRLAR